jgi:predicted secreted Zn-dependent protease
VINARLASLSLVAIAAAAIVAGCASSQPATPDAGAANAVPVSTPAATDPTTAPSTPTPTAAPTLAAALAPVPTPAATPAPVSTPAPTAVPLATRPPVATTTLVALPNLSKPIPGASKVAYFKVTGNTPSQIVAQIVAKSAKPCHSKTHDVLACVTWKGGGERWIETTNRSTGSCTVTSLTMVKSISTVHLPQLVGKKVQPALLAWWKPVVDHFAWHEGQHIKIDQNYDKKLRPLLIGHRCSAARGIIHRWEHKLDAAQHKFDVSDYHWQPEWSVPYTGSEA